MTGVSGAGDSPARVRCGYVDVNGRLAHFRRMERARGRTVLLLHQVSSSSRMFERIMPLLHAAGFDPVAPDLPGFGQSESLEEHSIPALADWVSDFVQAQDIATPLTLIGHHTGAGVATEVALRASETVAQMVLVGIPHFSGDEERNARWRAKRISAIDPVPDGGHLVHEWTRLGELSPQSDLRLRQREAVDTFLSHDYQGTYAALWEWTRTADISRLTCPVTIVACTLDHGLYHAQRPAAERIAHARLVEIDGAGVFAFDEHAADLAAVIDAACGPTAAAARR